MGGGKTTTTLLGWLLCGAMLTLTWAQNCPRPTGVNVHISGDDILTQEFLDGATVSFECAVGYTPAGGSPTVTCRAGQWTKLALQCEAFNCGPTKEVTNGKVTYVDGTSFGSEAQFSCNSGFLLVGSPRLTCGSTGWIGRVPSCEVVKCQRPDPVDNAERPFPYLESYESRAALSYKCLKGFTLNGSAVLTCSDTGRFTPNPPTCIKVSCPIPKIPNASWVSGSRPPYGYRSSVVYECHPGFSMQGSADLVCILNSTWSPKFPVCTAPSCPRPTGANMHISGDDFGKEEFLDGTIVSFECAPGYTAVGGSPTVTCRAGQWSQLTLECEEKQLPPDPGTLSPGYIVLVVFGVLGGIAGLVGGLYYGLMKYRDQRKPVPSTGGML